MVLPLALLKLTRHNKIMEFVVIILFFFSIPFFYIYGIVAFIRDITKRNNNSLTAKNKITQVSKVETTAPLATPEKKKQEHPDVIRNWYSTNSINLLLYVGAFFIVSSSAIFVSFQWDILPGIVKAVMLSLVAGAFLGCGLWFTTIPKIRNAGYAFIAIGAVLLPVLGSAWHTFVLQDMGITIGISWLITSLLAILLYIYLSYKFRSVFYIYATSIAALSFSLSTVNAFTLNSNFYILASIITCFFLLAIRIYGTLLGKDTEKFLETPLETSSHVLMLITLVYGGVVAIAQEKAISLEATLSMALASGFYLLSYYQRQKTWKLLLSEVFLPITIILFSLWQDIPRIILYYTLEICAAGYASIAYLLFVKKKQEESDSTNIISITLSLITIIAVWSTESALHVAPLLLLATGISIFVAYIKKDPHVLLLSSTLFGCFVYSMYTHTLQLGKFEHYLGLVFATLAMGAYATAWRYRSNIKMLEICIITTVGYFTYALSISFSNNWFTFGILLSIAMLFCIATLQFAKSRLLYGAVIFFIVALLQYLRIIHLDRMYYPYIFSVVSYMLFFISLALPKNYKHELRVSSLVTSLTFPIIFGLFYNESETHKNALISSYTTTVLYGLDTYFYKTKNFGYYTSAIGLFTFLWQINYFGITETLMYTTPIGMYFFVLGYIRRLRKDPKYESNFYMLSLFFLLLPPALLSLGSDAIRYSLFLGCEGLLLLFLGISLSHKTIRYGGIFGIVFAVIPQTYSYILILPRWFVIGVLGITFLGSAIFLLLKRKD